MTTETHLLLFRPAGQDDVAFEQALIAALPQGAALALALPESALPALAHVAARDPEVPDALVRLPDGADATALVALSDPTRGTAFAGARHAVLPGGDAIRLFFGLRRLPALSRAAFHDYWLNRHAEIGRRLIPPYTYHQLHADDAETLELAAASGLAASTYDGIVEVHFPDVDAFVHQLSRTDVAEEALEDEKNFIDHSRSRFWAFREVA
ncbi:EthD domain-containing protein [Novosphingobium sp. KCTC 2891]|uniref:EthD domain-containing protein n=1 Tax=Novosphingobium sp. KCTC 2891 TaxID=2989730 RepID=UPI00222286E0|nr:EthD domain-containing protein [Novosphingobium sp. KCTC 2891]MCW1382772.1 EthD domain-containing protein [Novosphingobium sp. KCTC 2891]